MRIGVLILPERRWSEDRGRWVRAEEMGFDHAWTYDHLAWRTLRDGPWYGTVPTLTAAALATQRMRLGTLVASPNFRHPVPFARDLMTLDEISGGRMTLGVGAGSSGWDAEILGQTRWSNAERFSRLEEFVEVLDRALRSGESTFRGEYYSSVSFPNHPGCVQKPRLPFAIAATGPRGLRLAARQAATWVSNGDRTVAEPVPLDESVQVIAEQIARLERACESEQRDAGALDRLVLTGIYLESLYSKRIRASKTALAAALSSYASVGVTDLVVHWPRASAPFAGEESWLSEIVEAVQRFNDYG